MMGKVYLLDCTLRDGGYINDWNFGNETIKDFAKKISQTGIEMFEVGFLKGTEYNPDRSIFPDTDSIIDVIQPKSKSLIYVGMLDMSNPISLEKIKPYDGKSIDGIRVIFKKNKMHEAYEYCEYIKSLGYMVFANFVGTDLYSDVEFIEGINLFNQLHPFAVSIVDTFGLIKKKQFLRLIYLADNNLSDDICLCYHAHNNLQQAFSNAEAMVEMNLKRDICIDACVFGMGRGAGNLNLELFSEYMNENYNTQYRIEPMLEIMDEYLNDIYKEKSWGYSLPFYLSATASCHPNYAIYFASKDTLTEKAFNELLHTISAQDRVFFSKEKAEYYYRKYQENYIDDKHAIKMLEEQLSGKKILMLAPGKNLIEYKDAVNSASQKDNTIVISVNFITDDFKIDYVFSSNMRRYNKIQGKTPAKCITTSNMKECSHTDYTVNFSRYAFDNPEIIDNSGLMLLRLLSDIGIKSVDVAGMDGYSTEVIGNYFDYSLEFDFSSEANKRNKLISSEIQEIQKRMNINFITPTQYNIV